MMLIKLRESLPKSSIALGATLADKHMQPVHDAAAESSIAPGSLVLLDFKGITGVNGSYIRGTALWVFMCGQLFANPSQVLSPPRHRADPRPYDLYVCVAGLSSEVKAEFLEFLKPRRLPLLFASKYRGDVVTEAELLGHLDPSLTKTLQAATQRGTVTAPELHKAFPDQQITVTAWNNRLNDLHGLRLLRRSQAGRVWKYESLAKKILWESHS